jgi:hypothetical protein
MRRVWVYLRNGPSPISDELRSIVTLNLLADATDIPAVRATCRTGFPAIKPSRILSILDPGNDSGPSFAAFARAAESPIKVPNRGSSGSQLLRNYKNADR